MDLNLDLVDYDNEDEGVLRFVFGPHNELVEIWECSKVACDIGSTKVGEEDRLLDLVGGPTIGEGTKHEMMYPVP
jgi:hypothetical protein